MELGLLTVKSGSGACFTNASSYEKRSNEIARGRQKKRPGMCGARGQIQRGKAVASAVTQNAGAQG
jgi:hypothetical protein